MIDSGVGFWTHYDIELWVGPLELQELGVERLEVVGGAEAHGGRASREALVQVSCVTIISIRQQIKCMRQSSIASLQKLTE